MAASSSTSVPNTTENPALSLICKQLQNLRLKLVLICQREQSLIVFQAKSISLRKRLIISHGKSKSLQKVRRYKSVVSAQISMLENLIKDISSNQLPPNHQLAISSVLTNNFAASLQVCAAKRGRGVVAEDQFNLPMSKKSTPMQADEESSRHQLKSGLRSCLNINVATRVGKPRYLCVSNGIAICCLDLSKSQSLTSAQDIPPLADVDTLNLLEDHRRLPVSVGLFNLGSEAYMIGGQVFPALVEGPPYPWFISHENSRGLGMYKSLCDMHRIKGSSRVTYRLSLVDGTLSLSHCNIKKLKKPKIWPIVEKMDGDLHVFDTIPCLLHPGGRHSWIFSHEVRSPDGHWNKVQTPSEKCYIYSHSVVGNHIYAICSQYGVCSTCFVVFDSKTKKWEGRTKNQCYDALSPYEVLDILGSHGIARCAGEFRYGGEPGNPVYVVIGLVQDYDDEVLQVAAYMVDSMGKIICYQRLPHLFEGGPVQPNFMYRGTIIKDDEDGKTMCLIMDANASDRDRYLFINTFSVEMLTSSAPKVQQWLTKPGRPLEEEFVHVTVKGNFIYQTDGVELKRGGDLSRFVAIQACFL